MNQNLAKSESQQLCILGARASEPGTCSKHPETSRTAQNVDSAADTTELFTATAVHDLKGHLQLIANGISLLRRSYEKALGVRGAQVLIGMSSGVARMNGLIADILVLSKVKVECHRLELVDLNEIAGSAVADLQPVIDTNHAKVALEELPVVCGDKAQLYQVFQNLLSNALKYRKPEVDPVLTICSHVVSHDELPSQDRYHEISIEDNGIGFTHEQGELIFEAFHRLNNPGIEGSGLGLSICQRIVTGHRGSIRAEGSPGEGAKFFIRLPCIECCQKSDDCPFAATSYDKKCPALEVAV